MNRSIASILIFATLISVFSPLFANRAEAQFATFDVGLNPLFAFNTPIQTANSIAQTPAKEYTLDAIAFFVANLAIQKIAGDTLKWINSGFQGSPAFVTDVGGYFKNIADNAAGQIIYNHPDIRFMCAPFQAKVRIALNQSYIQPYNFQCTLSDVGRNFDNFMNDFNQGGWDNFIEVSQRSQNNPLGLYNQLQNQMNINISRAVENKKLPLDWGRGFQSFERCIGEEGRGPDGICIGAAEITTPGAVISEQLNNIVSGGFDRLLVADEIDEIISALLSQLTAKAIGAIGGGLRSLSGSGPGDTGSYANQLITAGLTNIIDMPPDGKCPDYYLAISPTQCGTNDEIRDKWIKLQNAQSVIPNLLPPPVPTCGTPSSPTPCPPPTPLGSPGPAPLNCPAAPQIQVVPSTLTVGGPLAVVIIPTGWAGGTIRSDTPEVAAVGGLFVSGVSPGTALILASGFTAPNGATNCPLTGVSVRVN